MTEHEQINRAKARHTYRYTEAEHERQQSEDIKRQKAQRKSGELATGKVLEHTDELLAEIDELLIEDAAFAVNYLQAGGE